MDIEVVNIVASASTGVPFDLTKIAMGIDEAVYIPDKFPGLVYKLKEPKTALLLFTSGRLVCTGARNFEQVHKAVETVLENISKVGIDIPGKPEINIQNIVATSDLKTKLNMNQVAISFGIEKVEYEPEQFPGVVYRVQNPKVVALLFSTGKVVLTGAKKIEYLDIALQEIVRELSRADLL